MSASPESLEQQKDYYRRRAPVYDRWWRPAEHPGGPEVTRRWHADADEVEAWVSGITGTGRVLELAAGTGLFTRLLVDAADHVTAVDTSAEVLELNRRRLPDVPVSYEVADVFALLPAPEPYDTVAFTFWHSHVPDARLDPFWDGVAASLAPGGRVVLVDSAPWPSDDLTRLDVRHEDRTLPDGSSHTIVKRYWDPTALTERLRERGWDGEVGTTSHRMILRGVLTRR